MKYISSMLDYKMLSTYEYLEPKSMLPQASKDNFMCVIEIDDKENREFCIALCTIDDNVSKNYYWKYIYGKQDLFDNMLPYGEE